MGRFAAAFAFLSLGIGIPCAAQDRAALDLFTRADKGYCISCHQLPPGSGPATKDDLGPRLEGARMRALGAKALRDLINDPTAANPDTVMPPFGKHRLLDAREIDKVVEYLLALP